MSNMSSFFTQYWRMIRNRSAIATGIVAVFFFVAGIVYMRAFDWSMAVTSTDQFCISCHEMKDNVYPVYTESIHYSNRSVLVIAIDQSKRGMVARTVSNMWVLARRPCSMEDVSKGQNL